MKYTACFWLIFSCISCSKPVKPNNEITKVELARVIAIANRGTVLDIDTSLNYTFCKFYTYHKEPGKNQSTYYKGKIGAPFWDTLNRRLEEIKYRTLDTTDKAGIIDGEYYELIVHWKNGRKRITRCIPFEHDSLLSLLDWLENSYKSASLKQTKIGFKFETGSQNPAPPHPKVDQIKFPPPIKR